MKAWKTENEAYNYRSKEHPDIIVNMYQDDSYSHTLIINDDDDLRIVYKVKRP